MKKIIVGENDKGQRADRFLSKLLPNANKNFIMKMIRKKNIVNNSKRMNASDILNKGDEITIYFSDETFEKFSKRDNTYAHINLDIVYEDENILVVDKASGLLSHSASNNREKNLIDGVIAYLIESGQYSPRNENSFIPALCNRLDRNTAGLVIVGKNAVALKTINEKIRERDFKKIYNAIVLGNFTFNGLIEDRMVKDDKKNRTNIVKSKDGTLMQSDVKPIIAGEKYSLVEIDLITGRTHQIRAQLAHLNHPILGDPKYGSYSANRKLDSLDMKNHQLLASVEMILPELDGELKYLSNKKFTSKYKAKLMEVFKELNE
ncbi:RluA family pseudouridine synthase [uncultured Ezakiella sp.]|uniref:RluA family pseudouridine synthase n=1 Tax=uncultured Ezakiella sp. TaxID=1637529 RepID=UPI0025D08DDA|nr:RluA family pseudouridine synthase [uncultured Ezakiella sp.]